MPCVEGGDWTLSIISWEYDWMPRAGRSNQWKSIEQLFPCKIWRVFPWEIETPNSKFHKIIWSPKYSQQKHLPFVLKGDLFEPTPKCCWGAFAVKSQWTFTINYIVGGVHRRKFQGVPYNLDVQSKNLDIQIPPETVLGPPKHTLKHLLSKNLDV